MKQLEMHISNLAKAKPDKTLDASAKQLAS
jgi:hypothetical protein